MARSVIKASGSYLPSRLVSNDELAKTITTSDEWIFSRTGIKQRHIAQSDELVSHMAAKAGKIAIDKAGLTPGDIDLIILATTTPDKIFPATAVITQALLGIKNGAAFDVQAVCSGFIYAISIADSMIKTGNAKNILVIGADKMSSIVNWSDRTSCILFGDGAGAVVISAEYIPLTSQNSSDILGFDLCSDGQFQDILYANNSPATATDATEGKLVMHGKEVFKHAVEKMGSSLKKLIEKTGLEISNIDWLIPHQANIRIIDALAVRLAFPDEKIIKTVALHANTSAASIPLALDHALASGQAKKGQLVAMTAIGGGLSWGSCILKL